MSIAAGGSTLATKRLPIGPLSMAQLNVGNDLGQTDVAGASLVVSTSTPGGAFAAYASAIDRATGDPRTLLPAPDAGSGPWVLPSSARVSGAAGTFWTTDLTVANLATSATAVTLKFLGHSGDGRSGPVRSLTLQPREARTYVDVLGSLFGLSGDYGPLLVTSSGGALSVLGQTSTPGAGGTYGQGVPAAPPSDWIGAVPRTIPGVREDGSFRTNLMMASAMSSALDVDIVLVGANGSTLATKRVTIGPLSMAQLNVPNDLGQANVAGASLVVSTPTPGGAFAA